jgi:ATP/ADP translocase
MKKISIAIAIIIGLACIILALTFRGTNSAVKTEALKEEHKIEIKETTKSKLEKFGLSGGFATIQVQSKQN